MIVGHGSLVALVDDVLQGIQIGQIFHGQVIGGRYPRLVDLRFSRVADKEVPHRWWKLPVILGCGMERVAGAALDDDRGLMGAAGQSLMMLSVVSRHRIPVGKGYPKDLVAGESTGELGGGPDLDPDSLANHLSKLALKGILRHRAPPLLTSEEPRDYSTG